MGDRRRLSSSFHVVFVSGGELPTGMAPPAHVTVVCAPGERLPMRIVARPFLPRDDFAALQARASDCSDLTIDRSVPSLRPVLASSMLSVSQCGYNTALDLLQPGIPALVVLFAEGREDEQRARASRLEALGAVRVLDPDALSGPRLARELVATHSFAPAAIALDMDGAHETLRVVTRLRQSPLSSELQEAEYA